MIKKTMEQISYGIEKPSDLLSKLKKDADRLTRSPDPHDVFNFIVTAAVLADWIQQFYRSAKIREIFKVPKNNKDKWLLPSMSPAWIINTECLPNKHCDFRRHIENALSICWYTANASKHFHWYDGGQVTTIGEDPSIRSWYQYFFTSRKPDLYIEFNGENYGLQQISGILLQFFSGIIEYFDGIQMLDEN